MIGAGTGVVVPAGISVAAVAGGLLGNVIGVGIVSGVGPAAGVAADGCGSGNEAAVDVVATAASLSPVAISWSSSVSAPYARKPAAPMMTAGMRSARASFNPCNR